MKLFSSLAAVALLGFLLAVFTAQHGCASSCGNNCPATTVFIGSIDDAPLSIAFDENGPACPPISSLVCTGDESTTACTHTSVTGQAPGACDVLVVFNPYSDMRRSEIIHLEFGQPYKAPGTCCGGYPVLGPSVYVIPDNPISGGIYGLGDGGAKEYDAITFAPVDGSADGAADAGADSLPADAK
jgi:hypothetical protein